jgi:hypothetical protein
MDNVQQLVKDFLNNPRKRQKTAINNLKVFLSDHPELKGKVTAKTFETELSQNPNVQVFKKLPRPKEYLPIFSKNDNSFQMDITYMHDVGYSTFKYLLTAIDVNSRQAYAYPIKTKSNEEVSATINRFLQDVREKTHAPVYSITTDLGSEFNKLPSMLEDKNIMVYQVNQGDKTKMGKIERFHRTLREKFKDILPNTEFQNWTEVLPDILANYNESHIHRALGHAPDKYNEDDKANQFYKYKQLYKKIAGPKPENEMEVPKDEKVIRIRSSALEKAPNPFKKNTFETPMSLDTFNVAHIYPSGTVSIFKPGHGWDNIGGIQNLKDFVVSDRAGPKRFKPYDIMKVNKSSSTPLNENFFRKIKIQKQKNTQKRKLKAEGVDEKNIIETKRVRVNPNKKIEKPINLPESVKKMLRSVVERYHKRKQNNG